MKKRTKEYLGIALMIIAIVGFFLFVIFVGLANQ